MHAVTPRVVAIAVRIAMTVWITNFHFSLFIVLVFKLVSFRGLGTDDADFTIILIGS